MKRKCMPPTVLKANSKANAALLFLVMALSLSSALQAGLYPLTKITDNGPGLIIDPYQFTVDVQYYSDEQTLLVFANNNTMPPMSSAPLDSSIAGIYIDDTLISFDSFIGLVPDTIEFVDKGMGKMPGGQIYGFTKDDFFAGSAKPGPKAGLNPGESIGLLFDLNGAAYSAINTAIGNGSLRIGLHVISITYGETNVSESFRVPEPQTLCLLGMGGLFLVRSYRSKQR